jgi:thiosulfate/3-mercaptopyruvate sulfurtransferase
MPALLRRSLVVAASLVTAGAAMAQSTKSAPLLIAPAELSRALDDPNLVVLHVGPREDYDAGHVAGARFVELRELSTPRREGALALELPDDSTLRDRLESLGIGDRSRVVVAFGDEWVSPATRVVFTLHAAGLGDRTRFLDGGAAAWSRAGLPLVREAPPPAERGRLTTKIDRSLVVDHEFVQRSGRTPGIALLDARAPMFYEGPGMRDHGAGHVPGAANVPFNSLFDDSLRVLSVAELRSRFAAAGVRPGDTVVAYCHIGQQATVVLFAARLLGHPVRLYDGSMDDWEKRGLPLDNPTRGERPSDTPPAGSGGR